MVLYPVHWGEAELATATVERLGYIRMSTSREQVESILSMLDDMGIVSEDDVPGTDR
jgi:hypothetical protein